MPRLTRVAPEIPAEDLRGAIGFYEKLGFEVASQMPGYAILDRDGIALHLYDARTHRATPTGVHIFTPDLAELYEEFLRRGIPVEQNIQRRPWGNRDFRVRDPFGNELKFTEPRTDEE